MERYYHACLELFDLSLILSHCNGVEVSKKI